MDEQVILISHVLFWTLAGAAACLPLRWSLLAFVLVTHIDVTGPTFDSATTVGFENAVKTVLLPTLLFLRFCSIRQLVRGWSWPLVLWILLIVWAAVSLLWSPFQISGLKMIGYLYAYLAACAVLLEGWKRQALSPSLLAAALWLSLILAAIQTWVLDNPYGRSLPGFNDDRFTSFCTPQFFAAFLLAIMSVLLVTRRLSLLSRLLHGGAGTVGLLLCGSRYVFLGALAMAVVISFSYGARSVSGRRQSYRMAGGLAILLFVAAVLGFYFEEGPSSRIGELLTVLARGESPFNSIGTLIWRKGIYEQALSRISAREPAELVFGSGTSSGASIVLGYDRRYTENHVDANRVVHNELLRSLYEWGILGFLLFVGVLVTLAWVFVRSAVIDRVYPAFAFLALFPTIFLGCLSENILAGSGSPAGIGFLISLTYGIAYSRRWVEGVSPR
jgi:hypothetical protein